MEFKGITGGLARNAILIFDDRVSKHSFLAQLMAPESLPLPATRGQTKALLHNVRTDKCPQKLRLVT